ncbi:GIY-YIG nuclease family protein [Mesonia ostreae]|uniref:GIY-YIG nuclease family protein n=1 Tax=Mesonia ostreae TaxID=861110 RepID=UPI0035CE8925
MLHSATLKKFYTGETKDIRERLKMHNRHSFKNAFTKAANDWCLELTFECKNGSSQKVVGF